MVPNEFITLLKLALAKMVSAGILDDSIIDLEFWMKWPKKFTSISQYENNKKKTTDEPPSESKETKGKGRVIIGNQINYYRLTLIIFLLIETEIYFSIKTSSPC